MYFFVWNFSHRCEITWIHPRTKFTIENIRNSLSNSMKKADIIGKNIFLIIHQRFHEFSGKQNQPGITKKKTQKFLLGKLNALICLNYLSLNRTASRSINIEKYVFFILDKSIVFHFCSLNKFKNNFSTEFKVSF